MSIIHLEDLKSNILNKKNNIVKAYCSKTEDATKLITLGLIVNYQKFKVEKFVKRNQVVICFRCSGFGHVAKNCKNKEEKCFKCSNNHPAWNCHTKGQPTKELKCPSCHGNHPQTYAGCVAFKKELTRINSAHNIRNSTYHRNDSVKPSFATKTSSPEDPIAVLRKSIAELVKSISTLAQSVAEISVTVKEVNSKQKHLESNLNDLALFSITFFDKLLSNTSNYINFTSYISEKFKLIKNENGQFTNIDTTNTHLYNPESIQVQ